MTGKEPASGASRTDADPPSAWAPIGAALSVSVIYVAVLSLPLGTASDLGLTTSESTSWIIAIYGVSGVLSLAFVMITRQPVVLTGNVFILFFVASLGADVSWAELVGGAIVAGVAVLIVTFTGLTDRLAEWLPTPIVFGVLAGITVDFFTDMFTLLGGAPVVVGGTILAYLVSRSTLGDRVPPILPSLIVGFALSAAVGGLGSGEVSFELPTLTLTTPEFSSGAILTVAPVVLLLITVQANVPSLVYLRGQGYTISDGPIGVASGAGTAVASLLGPAGVSLSLPATALCAGPDAGALNRRHLAAGIAAIASISIGALAGLATQIAGLLPDAYLFTIVGLAVLEIVIRALRAVTEGPLLLGPLFAFAIALSDLTLLGLDNLFWALVLGMAVSALFEKNAWPRHGQGSS